MARRINKKDRKRRKHQLHKLDKNRLKHTNPYRRLAQTGEVVACYVNENWKTAGGAMLYVLRKGRNHSLALAVFYVDLWCMGLKDAWGRIDISMKQFRERILNPSYEKLNMQRVDLDFVKRLVAGGLRFADQNGFRLPPHYQRWVALLGDLGNREAADLDDFGCDGKLYYIGNLADLRLRYIKGSADDFLHRKDVEFIMGENDFTLLDDERLDIEESDDYVRDSLLNEIRTWCFANQLIPHPALPDAIDILLEFIHESDSPDREGEEFSPGHVNQSQSLVDSFINEYSVVQVNEIGCAIEQLVMFIRLYENPEKMIASLLDETDNSPSDLD